MNRVDAMYLGIKIRPAGDPDQLSLLPQADQDFLIDCFETNTHDDAPLYLLNLMPLRTLEWLVTEHRAIEAENRKREGADDHDDS